MARRDDRAGPSPHGPDAPADGPPVLVEVDIVNHPTGLEDVDLGRVLVLRVEGDPIRCWGRLGSIQLRFAQGLGQAVV